MELLIDGDVICYDACRGVFEGKNRDVHPDGSTSVQMYDGEIIFHTERAWRNLKDIIADKRDFFFLSDAECRIAVKGEGNFRSDVFDAYKKNRTHPPIVTGIVRALRERLVEEYGAVPADGMEADDLLSIWAYERDLKDCCVVSVDKDLLCIPGMHMHRGNVQRVSEEDAMRFYYEQIIKGDPTDNIPGCPGIGNVKAKKILAPASCEEEYRVLVYHTYSEFFGDDAKDVLQLNGTLIHLLRSWDDKFDCTGWGA